MTCKPFENCFEFVNQNHLTVTCTDHKSSTTFIYDNRSSDTLTKYRIDGCLISDEGAKCDFLLLNCNKKQSFFIELKEV